MKCDQNANVYWEALMKLFWGIRQSPFAGDAGNCPRMTRQVVFRDYWGKREAEAKRTGQCNARLKKE